MSASEKVEVSITIDVPSKESPSASKQTWGSWLSGFQVDVAEILKSNGDSEWLPASVLQRNWEPSEADRKAAWEFYTELRTRITTQPLHYTHGDEATALKSVSELFGSSRELMRKHGREARHFAILVTFFLNKVLRPFTAQWHKSLTTGCLENEDSRHDLREKLQSLQDKIRVFGSIIGKLAEGDSEFQPGTESWPQRLVQPAAMHVGTGAPAAVLELSYASLGGDIAFDRLLFDAVVSKDTQDEIRDNEKEEVRARRKAMQQTAYGDLSNLAGLAISGGGLRSATFALGVVQALSEKHMLGQFDYLSTVSGGGYLGSFLSSYLNSPKDPKNESSTPPGKRDPQVGPNADCLPFKKPAVGESAALRHLRSQSKFLLNGGTLGRFRMLLQALFGMATNAAILFPWIAIAVLLATYYSQPSIKCAVDAVEYNYLRELFSLTSQRIVSVPLIVLFTLLPIVLRQARRDSWVWLGTGYLWFTSGWLVLFLGVTGWNSLPALFRTTERIADFFVHANWLPNILKSEWLAPVGLAVLQGIGRLIGTAGRQRPWAVVLTKLITRTAGPLLLSAVFIILGRTIILGASDVPLRWIDELEGPSITPKDLLVLVTFGLLIYDHLFLDINLSSLHPFYRDRLSEAYLVQRRPTADGANDAEHVDRTKLSELRRSEDSTAPYHLINTALNAPAGKSPSLRGRHCDFFVFSKHFCGSPSTGYHSTSEFEALDPALNLGTALAISAAAASPFMGTGSGETSFLLALFNIRLDYWLQFPKRLAIPPFSWKPGPWYLGRQLLGRVHEETTYLNLSDGGHIENLAIYELLRRRCKFIVAVDGECDPLITCGSLVVLMRYAKIDFGIDIKIDLSRFQVRRKALQSAENKSVATDFKPQIEKDAEAAKDDAPVVSPIVPFHFALGEIDYTPHEKDPTKRVVGWLLYVKSSLTGNEGPTIMNYRSQHADFPHQSTSDLFYNEEQFEAYRALGHHIATDLFRTEIMGTNNERPSIRDWFERFVTQLRDPNYL